MTLKANIKAMREDADLWRRVAKTAYTAGQAASELTLGESQLSWASATTGLLVTYEQIQAKVAGLLVEATANYAALSEELDAAATAYETNDEEASIELRGIWEPRE